jgi:predicted TPR repeat methyltransferase
MADHDQILKKVYDAAGDTAALSDSYDDWAESYDADLCAMGYRYPFMMAGTLGRFVPDLSSRILDAGCGSGLVGEAFSLLGYRHLTGIDISDGMLAEAAAKNCYSDLRREALGEPLSFETSSFDTITSSGVMTAGHAPPDCLTELTRVLKSGGHMVVTISRPAWEDWGYRDATERLAADRIVSPLFNSAYFVSLPGAAPEERHEASVHVMRKL